MNSRLRSMMLASAIAAITVAALSVKSDVKDRQVGEKVVGLSKRKFLADGGKVYVVEVEADGGVEERKVSTPGCVRRPRNAPVDDCLRLIGGKPTDIGELNRFPESEAAGPGCQPVACSIIAGEDSEAEE